MRKLAFLIISAIGVFVIWSHNIDNSITSMDEDAFRKMGRLEIRDSLTAQQIITALHGQAAYLFKTKQPIPVNHPREPADLMRFRSGYCYDWSRTFSKLLVYHGFRARQVSVYQTEGDWSNLIKKNIISHAGIEVFLNDEWIYFDPYYGWWAEDISGNLYTTKEVISIRPGWKSSCPQKLYDMSKVGGHTLYGIYSRHGLFYPPFDFIPDYNLSDFLINFKS